MNSSNFAEGLHKDDDEFLSNKFEVFSQIDIHSFLIFILKKNISLQSLDYDKIYNVIDIKDELISDDYSVNICIKKQLIIETSSFIVFVLFDLSLFRAKTWLAGLSCCLLAFVQVLLPF